MTQHAIICGAGIGGLTAALSLQQQGWQVSVLERSPQLQEVGAGLQLSPNGCKVLAQLGLLEAVQAQAFNPECIQMRVGLSGAEVFSIALKEMATQRWGAPYLHIHRADLLAVLQQALQQTTTGTLQLNCAVHSYQQHDRTISAVLENGTTLSADLLIAADGIHSSLRTQMLGQQPAQFTGNVAWRAVVPTHKLGQWAPEPNACVWVGKGRHAVTYRLKAGELVNIVGVVERDDWQAESWTEQGTAEQALADFDGWHPVISTALEQADSHFRWALFDRPPLPRWHDGAAVLLGDACHPMLPFLAQGANMAMEDAWVLSQSLSQHHDLEQALGHYYQARIARTSQVQAAARGNMKVFHKPGWAYAPVRLATKIKPDLMHRRMDWLYGHDPSLRKTAG